MIELNEENFEKETEKGKVVIDCYAPWCGVCRMIKPKVDELSNSKPEYKFCLLDVDQCPKIAELLKVANLPTIIVMEEGQEVKRGSYDALSFLEGK